MKGATVGVFILIGSLTLIFSLIANNFLLIVSLLILYGGILALPFLWAPRGYAIRGDGILVKRAIGDAKIIVAEPPQRWSWTWWGIRLFGSGGLYGYYGYFAFRGLGKVLMYATNRHKLVLIRDDRGRRYLISPDNPQEFIKQLRRWPIGSQRATIRSQ